MTSAAGTVPAADRTVTATAVSNALLYPRELAEDRARGDPPPRPLLAAVDDLGLDPLPRHVGKASQDAVAVSHDRLGIHARQVYASVTPGPTSSSPAKNDTTSAGAWLYQAAAVYSAASRLPSISSL